MISAIGTDGQTAILAPLDYGFEHHILISQAGYKETDIGELPHLRSLHSLRGGGFVRRLAFKFPPENQATLILTGVSTSPLLYRASKLTTLLFLKIFNAPFTSAFSNIPSEVLYSPLCIRFPLK